MQLIEDLKTAAAVASSPFAAQLLKEDIGRLERLEALAAQHADFGSFRKLAMVQGWTQGDFRTFELDPELTAFLQAFFAALQSGGNASLDAAWQAFHRRRMALLVGCLSRPRIEDL